MKVYSVEIPPRAPGTFYKKDGVYYHTQDLKYPQHPFFRHLWNPITKTTNSVSNELLDTIVCPLVMCHPQDVNDYVN